MKAIIPFIVRVLTAMIAVVSNYFVSLVLGVEFFGLYSSMLSITFVLGLFSDWGLSVYGAQLLASSEDKKEFINQSLNLKFWLCLICIIPYLWFCFENKEHFILLITGLPIIILSFLNPEWIARGLMKPNTAAYRQLLFSVLNVSCFLLIYYLSLPKIVVFISYTFNTIFSFTIIYQYLKKIEFFGIIFNKNPFEILNKTTFYFGGYLANNLVYTTGAIMLTLFGTNETMGIYSSYYNIFATIIAPAAITFGLFNPKVKIITKELFYKDYISVMLFVIVVGIVFYLNGNFFYNIFYPKSFIYYSNINSLACFTFIFYCLENIFVVNSILIKKPKTYLMKNLAGIAVVIICWIYLIISKNINVENAFRVLLFAQIVMFGIGLILYSNLISYLKKMDILLFIILILVGVVSKVYFNNSFNFLLLFFIVLIASLKMLKVLRKLY